MLRIVVDTNVLVSALLNRQGPPAQLFRLVLGDPAIQICVSGAVYAEYDEVLRRPKFKRSDAEVEGILGTMRKSAFWVKPTEDARACIDPDDDMFLACAQAARAQYLVTGNTRHFPARWNETQIVTVRQFLDLVG